MLIDEVEVGKRYELVLTTISGFYRYRMGDVVEVVGFHEELPGDSDEVQVGTGTHVFFHEVNLN